MTKSENVVRRVRAAGLERNEKRESKGRQFLAGRERLQSEPVRIGEFNPDNTGGVRGVEVLVPSSRLPGGRCFVDSSGLGSAFTGNTAATRAFIPTSMRRWS